MATDYRELFNNTIYKPSYTQKELDYIEDPVFGKTKVPDGFKLIQDQDGNGLLWPQDLVLNSQTEKPKEQQNMEITKAPEEDNEIITNNKNFSNNITGDKKYVFDFFYNKFYNHNKQRLGDKESSELAKIQSAGTVGNLIQESGLKTGIKGDGGKALGLAQWHPDRQKGLKALADSRGVDITDLDTQLEYIWQELNTTEKKALDSLSNVRSISEATTNFMKNFERPNSDPKINKLSQRIKHAESFLS